MNLELAKLLRKNSKTFITSIAQKSFKEMLKLTLNGENKEVRWGADPAEIDAYGPDILTFEKAQVIARTISEAHGVNVPKDKYIEGTVELNLDIPTLAHFFQTEAKVEALLEQKSNLENQVSEKDKELARLRKLVEDQNKAIKNHEAGKPELNESIPHQDTFRKTYGDILTALEDPSLGIKTIQKYFFRLKKASGIEAFLDLGEKNIRSDKFYNLGESHFEYERRTQNRQSEKIEGLRTRLTEKTIQYYEGDSIQELLGDAQYSEIFCGFLATCFAAGVKLKP